MPRIIGAFLFVGGAESVTSRYFFCWLWYLVELLGIAEANKKHSKWHRASDSMNSTLMSCWLSAD